MGVSSSCREARLVALAVILHDGHGVLGTRVGEDLLTPAQAPTPTHAALGQLNCVGLRGLPRQGLTWMGSEPRACSTLGLISSAPAIQIGE